MAAFLIKNQQWFQDHAMKDPILITISFPLLRLQQLLHDLLHKILNEHPVFSLPFFLQYHILCKKHLRHSFCIFSFLFAFLLIKHLYFYPSVFLYLIYPSYQICFLEENKVIQLHNLHLNHLHQPPLSCIHWIHV
jgi:hypothetical protein